MIRKSRATHCGRADLSRLCPPNGSDRSLCRKRRRTAIHPQHFLVSHLGALVMWMCAGFTMLEAGSVRTKNASMICLKNIGLYSIAGITYYLVGYNLMYVDVQAGWVGTLKFYTGFGR